MYILFCISFFYMKIFTVTVSEGDVYILYIYNLYLSGSNAPLTKIAVWTFACCRVVKKTQRNSTMWFHSPPQLQSIYKQYNEKTQRNSTMWFHSPPQLQNIYKNNIMRKRRKTLPCGSIFHHNSWQEQTQEQK